MTFYSIFPYGGSTPTPPSAAGEFKTDGADILWPNGDVFYGAGMNVAFNVLTGTISGTPVCFPFVFSGFQFNGSPYDGAFDTAAVSGLSNVYPGGGVNSSRSPNTKGTTPAIYDSYAGGIIDLEDRYYAINGTVTPWAAAHGRTAPPDHWHQNLIRPTLVSKGSPTPPTTTDIINSAVPSIQEALDAGVVCCPEIHDLTGDNNIPGAAYNAPASSFSGDFGSTVTFWDAIATQFKTNGSGTGAGTANARAGYLWFDPTNEPWNNSAITGGAPPQAYFDTQTFWIKRFRLHHGAENIIVINLSEYGQNLYGVAQGHYDAWWATLQSDPSGDLTRNVVLSWHAYGARGNAQTSPAWSVYDYNTMDTDIAAVKAKGYPLVIGEYGMAVGGAGNAGPHFTNVNAVEYLTTNIHGQPLADKYNLCPTVWHATGDAIGNHYYKLVRGPSLDTNDSLSTPFWRISSGSDTRLELLGQRHWNISHTIWAKN